jgi:large repetitive protein
VTSGETTIAPVVNLVPVTTEETRTVSGRVSPMSNPTGGIAGAVLSFQVGSSTAYTTTTSSTGAFQITLAEGVYQVSAAAPGYGTVTISVTVNRSITGLLFLLPAWGWNVSLTVVDGLTQSPLNGSVVELGSANAGTTNGAGVLGLSLPNGTYYVNVSANASQAAFYVPVTFTLEIAGAGASRVVDLYPAVASLSGTVRAKDGAPVVGATVALAGTAADGAAYVRSVSTDANGEYTVPAYAGTYTVTVSASGFQSASQGVSLSGGPSALSITLTPAATVASASSGPSVWLVGGIGVALVAGAFAAVYLFGRSRSPRT